MQARGASTQGATALAADQELGALRPLVAKRPAHPRMAQLTIILRKPDFLVTWLIPFFVFSVLVLLFCYGFMMLPNLCVLVAMFFAFIGVVLVMYWRRSPLYLPLGATTITAVVVGVFVGLYLYDTYAVYPAFYRHSRTYTNVVPSQPSAAVADAGHFTFTAESFVDANRSVGFIIERGYTYCVAPIRDGTYMPRVEFWAVGMECCAASGRFQCDEAEDRSAHAGIRIFDNSGFFQNSDKDHYKEARQKAEASHGLISVDSPIYVRWVREENLNMVSNEYQNKAVLGVLMFMNLYLAASAALAFLLYRPRK